MFLEESECIIKEKMRRYFNDSLEISSDDSDEEKIKTKYHFLRVNLCVYFFE